MEEGLGIGLGTLVFLGIVWTVLWAFVPLAVARIWTHTADTSKRQKQALAEAQRQTEGAPRLPQGAVQHLGCWLPGRDGRQHHIPRPVAALGLGPGQPRRRVT